MLPAFQNFPLFLTGSSISKFRQKLWRKGAKIQNCSWFLHWHFEFSRNLFWYCNSATKRRAKIQTFVSRVCCWQDIIKWLKSRCYVMSQQHILWRENSKVQGGTAAENDLLSTQNQIRFIFGWLINCEKINELLLIYRQVNSSFYIFTPYCFQMNDHFYCEKCENLRLFLRSKKRWWRLIIAKWREFYAAATQMTHFDILPLCLQAHSIWTFAKISSIRKAAC